MSLESQRMNKKEKKRLEALNAKLQKAEEREELFKKLAEMSKNAKKPVEEDKIVLEKKTKKKKKKQKKPKQTVEKTSNIKEYEEETYSDEDISDEFEDIEPQKPKRREYIPVKATPIVTPIVTPNLQTKPKVVKPDPVVAMVPSPQEEFKVEVVEPMVEVPKKKAFYVLVGRTAEIQAQREHLPIVMEEQQIMEAIHENDFVIVCGETGSGKTTQVPQFLYEAGYGCSDGPYPGMIGVTEPRRVAAVSTAQRVAIELNQLPPSLDEEGTNQKSLNDPDRQVSYQVRYDGTVNKYTRIKFMTEGILLREIQSDFILARYSAIIIDEAHERTMNTDLLLGLLSRIVPLRRTLYEEKNPNVHSVLKVVIMSATLRVSDFVENKRMFPAKVPPVIQISARQFPVTIHFNRKTSMDYVQDAYDKVCKIHKRLPQGGILVFLTGQQEIESLCKMLNQKFMRGKRKRVTHEEDEFLEDVSDESMEEKSNNSSDEEEDSMDLEDSEESLEAKLNNVEGTSEEEDDDKEDDTDDKQKESASKSNIPKDMIVLPLFSMLSPKEQLKIFKPHDPNQRLVVVATNIAETSLTIPGITYVVDSGRVKTKVYDKNTGMTSYVVTFSSKASVDQRAGRAGRTGPGHCYRLFSSAVYQDLDSFSIPDILNVPIEGVVLQMKNMGIKSLESFPFPTPPTISSIQSANEILHSIGALKVAKRIHDKAIPDYKITSLGKSLTRFPISPRFAKMLVLALKENLVHHAIAIVSTLTVGDPFLYLDAGDPHLKERKALWSQWKSNTSDFFVYISAIDSYEASEDFDAFCEQYKLHSKSMKEIRLLREQLTNILNHMEETNPKLVFDRRIREPTKEEKLRLRQIIASGLTDQIAKREPLFDNNGAPMKNKYEYYTYKGHRRCLVHPTSFVRNISPEYIVYHEFIETTQNYIKGITAISLSWMRTLAPFMLQDMDKILEEPSPHYDVEKDRIVGTIQPKLKYGDWILPKTLIDLHGMEGFKYFARRFLEGEIVEEMKQFRPFLTSKPSLITGSWVQERIALLIQPLLDHHIDTLKKLRVKWYVITSLSKTWTHLGNRLKDPKFWLPQVALWVSESKHRVLMENWPPKSVIQKPKKGKPQG